MAGQSVVSQRHQQICMARKLRGSESCDKLVRTFDSKSADLEVVLVSNGDGFQHCTDCGNRRGGRNLQKERERLAAFGRIETATLRVSVHAGIQIQKLLVDVVSDGSSSCEIFRSYGCVTQNARNIGVC